MYDAVREAKKYVKKNGPMLIVAQTYRYLGHSKSDANKYRTKEEIAEWREKDPIPKFRKYLADNKICTEAELAKLDEKGKEDIEAAVTYAQGCAEPTLDDLLTDVYAD